MRLDQAICEAIRVVCYSTKLGRSRATPAFSCLAFGPTRRAFCDILVQHALEIPSIELLQPRQVNMEPAKR